MPDNKPVMTDAMVETNLTNLGNLATQEATTATALAQAFTRWNRFQTDFPDHVTWKSETILRILAGIIAVGAVFAVDFFMLRGVVEFAVLLFLNLAAAAVAIWVVPIVLIFLEIVVGTQARNGRIRYEEEKRRHALTPASRVPSRSVWEYLAAAMAIMVPLLVILQLFFLGGVQELIVLPLLLVLAVVAHAIPIYFLPVPVADVQWIRQYRQGRGLHNKVHNLTIQLHTIHDKIRNTWQKIIMSRIHLPVEAIADPVRDSADRAYGKKVYSYLKLADPYHATSLGVRRTGDNTPPLFSLKTEEAEVEPKVKRSYRIADLAGPYEIGEYLRGTGKTSYEDLPFSIDLNKPGHVRRQITENSGGETQEEGAAADSAPSRVTTDGDKDDPQSRNSQTTQEPTSAEATG